MRHIYSIIIKEKKKRIVVIHARARVCAGERARDNDNDYYYFCMFCLVRSVTKRLPDSLISVDCL